MMRKLLSILLVLILLMASCPAYAASLSYTISSGAAIITGSSGYLGNLIIPEEIDGYPVVGIADRAFQHNSTLLRVEMPDTIQYLGEYSFGGCDSLTSVQLSSALTEITANAFHSSKALTSIVIPEGVVSIDDYAFANCTGLRTVHTPSTLRSIGMCSFLNCTKLSSISLPDGFSSIGLMAFSDCKSLQSITIPNSCPDSSIGMFAFQGSPTVLRRPTGGGSSGSGGSGSSGGSGGSGSGSTSSFTAVIGPFTDSHNDDTVTIWADKSELVVGETIRVKYELDYASGPDYYDLCWFVFDENGKIIEDEYIFDRYASYKTEILEYTPQSPGKLYFQVNHFPGTGDDELWMYTSTTAIPVRTVPLEVTLTPNRSDTFVGDTLNVQYAVTGGAAPIQSISYVWTLQDADGNALDTLEGTRTASSGGVNFSPAQEGFAMFTLTATDAEGTTVTASLDTPIRLTIIEGIPRVAVSVDKNEIVIGESVSGTFAFSGGTQPYEFRGYIWAMYGEDGELYDTVYNETRTDTRTIAYTPQITGELYFGAIVKDQKGFEVQNLINVPVKVVPRTPGDADRDGLVTAEDALLILRYGAEESVAISTINGNVNDDSACDAQDALLILQHLSGWDVTLK